jgi:hypothetical protein
MKSPSIGGRPTMAIWGVSQRPLATLSGDNGRAYRRGLPFGAECQVVNVGGLLAYPKGDGPAAVDVASRCRSGHSSQR